MICAEWWVFEILTLLAGQFGSVELSACSVIFQIGSIEFMLIYGVGVASSTRVSNLLGAGLHAQARTSAKCALVCGLIVCALNITISIASRNYIGYIFTNETEVIDLVAQMMPIVATFNFFDGVQGVASGVIRGMGRQAYGAAINLISYWCLMLPAAIVFAFPLGLTVRGLWWGATIGLGVVATADMILLRLTNWEKEAEKAAIRTGAKLEDPKGGMENENDDIVLFTPLLPDGAKQKSEEL